MKFLQLFMSVMVLTGAASLAWAGGGTEKAWDLHYVKQPEVNAAKATPPAAPKLVSPEALQKIAGTNVTLTWEAVEGADAYHLQVATDPKFKWLVLDEKFFPQTSAQPAGLEVGKNYYWRVAAWKNGQEWGANKSYFSTSSFTTR